MLKIAMLQSAKYIESIVEHMTEEKIEMSNIAINIGANDGITMEYLRTFFTKDLDKIFLNYL